MLVLWIQAEDRAGRAPSYARLRAMAEEMLAVVGDQTGLGENWHKSFVNRHPTIKLVISRKVEAARIKECTKEQISAFFDRFESVKRQYKINDSNIHNMDESGLQNSETGRETVLADASSIENSIVVQEPAYTKWNTALECISAIREKIDPLIIFSGKHLWLTWLLYYLDPKE